MKKEITTEDLKKALSYMATGLSTAMYTTTIYQIEMGDIFSEMGFFDKSFEYYLMANKSNTDVKSNKRINQRLKGWSEWN